MKRTIAMILVAAFVMTQANMGYALRVRATGEADTVGEESEVASAMGKEFRLASLAEPFAPVISDAAGRVKAVVTFAAAANAAAQQTFNDLLAKFIEAEEKRHEVLYGTKSHTFSKHGIRIAEHKYNAAKNKLLKAAKLEDVAFSNMGMSQIDDGAIIVVLENKIGAKPRLYRYRGKESYQTPGAPGEDEQYRYCLTDVAVGEEEEFLGAVPKQYYMYPGRFEGLVNKGQLKIVTASTLSPNDAAAAAATGAAHQPPAVAAMAGKVVGQTPAVVAEKIRTAYDNLESISFVKGADRSAIWSERITNIVKKDGDDFAFFLPAYVSPFSIEISDVEFVGTEEEVEAYLDARRAEAEEAVLAAMVTNMEQFRKLEGDLAAVIAALSPPASIDKIVGVALTPKTKSSGLALYCLLKDGFNIKVSVLTDEQMANLANLDKAAGVLQGIASKLGVESVKLCALLGEEIGIQEDQVVRIDPVTIREQIQNILTAFGIEVDDKGRAQEIYDIARQMAEWL